MSDWYWFGLIAIGLIVLGYCVYALRGRKASDREDKLIRRVLKIRQDKREKQE